MYPLLVGQNGVLLEVHVNAAVKVNLRLYFSEELEYLVELKLVFQYSYTYMLIQFFMHCDVKKQRT